MSEENRDRRAAPTLVEGSAVLVVEDRPEPGVPVAALPLVRAARHVLLDPDVPAWLARALGGEPTPKPAELLALATREPVLLVVVDATSPGASALLEAGAAEVRGPGEDVSPDASPAWSGGAAGPGAALLEAVAVMDRLRSPGGCPWDAEQTHETLRQYLVEETYELLEAIEDRDRGALREELGDVLLQVLFHARIAAEHPEAPFDIDAVAAALVTKLVGRHPHVFGAESADPSASPSDALAQQARWEELKQVEKQRESAVDGVAFGQPAVALAAKIAARATKAGVPAEFFPSGPGAGERLFAVAAEERRAGGEPEGELRAVARAFAGRIRAAERAARSVGLDPHRLGPADWARFWPSE
ncbi:MazG family protein [Actinoalloteichus caeruleus]|uniref:MazG family protein n=1 Tax=Actinoalloteichus cyanogriseus TaxID=2893586 RepID=UPI0003F97170|nr:MazG family protein [Actinoalloteichus caeruleus]